MTGLQSGEYRFETETIPASSRGAEEAHYAGVQGAAIEPGPTRVHGRNSLIVHTNPKSKK